METAEIIGISRHRILRDGEGITTLVGMAGCSLHCAYCINKDILNQTHRHQYLSTKQLLEIVEKDDIYFRSTNGGTTFGGGEPLLHMDFIREFKSISPRVWKMNIETSMNVKTELLPDICDLADCLIIDIKTLDSEIYKRYTGFHNDYLNYNLSILSKLHMQNKVLIRIPLIPHFNDRADVEASIRKLNSLGFHNYKIVQYVDTLNKVSKPTPSNKYGKEICNLLKHIREIVAKANGVKLHEEKCPNDVCHTGTCPKCDNHLKYLTNELSKIENPIY